MYDIDTSKNKINKPSFICLHVLRYCQNKRDRKECDIAAKFVTGMTKTD